MASFEYLIKNPDLLHREWEPKKFNEFFLYVSRNHPLILEYVCSIQRPCINTMYDAALVLSTKGDLKNFKYLLEEGIIPNLRMFQNAVISGNDELIKLIYKYIGKFWEKKNQGNYVILEFCRFSSYDIFLFFISEGLDIKKLCPPNRTYYLYGSEGKFLDKIGVAKDIRILEYLVNQQYTYDSNTLLGITNSQVFEETLEFYLSKGVQINNEIITSAVKNNNFTFLNYLVKKGYTINDNDQQNMLIALQKGNYAMVDILLKEGVQYSWDKIGKRLVHGTSFYYSSQYRRCLNFFNSSQYDREEWKQKSNGQGNNIFYNFLVNLE